MKLALITATIAVTAVACGTSGATNADYQKGATIAHQELVVDSIQAGISPATACADAYEMYSGIDNVQDKGQYLKGCVDSIAATTIPTPTVKFGVNK